ASGPVCDFNGGGKQELRAADFRADVAPNALSVLLGNGDGTFQAPRNFPVGTGPVSVTVGDFNGDGRLDLVVANWCTVASGCNTGDTVSVLLGNGDGTFQAAQNFLAGRGVAFAAVG